MTTPSRILAIETTAREWSTLGDVRAPFAGQVLWLVEEWKRQQRALLFVSERSGDLGSILVARAALETP